MVAVSAAQAASPQNIRLEYDAFAGGLYAASLMIEANLAQGDYQATTRLRTRGFLDILFKWRGKGESRGVIGSNGLQPDIYRYHGKTRKGWRKIAMYHDEKGKLFAQVTKEGNWDIKGKKNPGPKALIGAPHDILSAIFQIVTNYRQTRQACKANFEVFDGKKRHEVTLAIVGDEFLKKNRYSAYTGQSVKCRLTYETKLAFERDLLKPKKLLEAEGYNRSPRPDVFIWFALYDREGLAIPVRIEAQSDFGEVIAHLTKFSINQIQKIALRRD